MSAAPSLCCFPLLCVVVFCLQMKAPVHHSHPPLWFPDAWRAPGAVLKGLVEDRTMGLGDGRRLVGDAAAAAADPMAIAIHPPRPLRTSEYDCGYGFVCESV